MEGKTEIPKQEIAFAKNSPRVWEDIRKSVITEVADEILDTMDDLNVDEAKRKVVISAVETEVNSLLEANMEFMNERTQSWSEDIGHDPSDPETAEDRKVSRLRALLDDRAHGSLAASIAEKIS